MSNDQSVQSFAPAIRLPGGRVYTPTGNEWLLFFATAGCQWAIDALKAKHEPAK